MRLWDTFTTWIDRELLGNQARCIDCAVNENRERKILNGGSEPLTNNERGDIKHFEDQSRRAERMRLERRADLERGDSTFGAQNSRKRMHPVPDGAIRWQDFPANRSSRGPRR